MNYNKSPTLLLVSDGFTPTLVCVQNRETSGPPPPLCPCLSLSAIFLNSVLAARNSARKLERGREVLQNVCTLMHVTLIYEIYMFRQIGFCIYEANIFRVIFSLR